MRDHINLQLTAKLTTRVTKQAFIDVVNGLNATMTTLRICTEQTQVHILEDSNNLIIDVVVALAPEAPWAATLQELKDKIEVHCQLLMDQKPANILINCTGTY